MTVPLIPSRIRGLAQDLAGPREQIETAFVAVGARLTEGAAMLNRLTRQFEALPAALQGADVAAAVDQLRAVADEAEALSAAFVQEKADLARLGEVVAAASGPIGELQRTVKMMGIVSINARVTAAGIVGDSNDFDVFTTDIATLSGTASRTIQEFAQVYRQLTAEVERAAGHRARFETAHGDTLTRLSNDLGRALVALKAQQDAAAQGSAETGRVSRQIVGRIASAVMALQVGDSTRQRLEHVETGLSVLADLVEHHTAFEARLAVDDLPEAVAAVVALEQAQLADTATCFADEVDQAEAALVELASDAGTIMASSRDLYGGGGDKSALTELSTLLRAAVAILRDVEVERSKLEAVAAAVQTTVAVLLGHVAAVQDIEANMRLVSLNAAVRCAQLGPRGASLSVIATQLRELTTETVVAAQAAMARLDESSALAGAFGAAAAGDSAGRIGRLEQQANAALSLLLDLDGQVEAALKHLHADGPRIIALLDAAADGLSGQSALAEAMSDAGLAIAELASDPAPSAPVSEVAAVLEGLRRTYTMEVERLIHTHLFDAVSSVVVAANEDAEVDLADFML